VYRSPLNWRNGGSVDVTLQVGELRPLGEYLFEDEELVLVLPLARESHVLGKTVTRFYTNEQMILTLLR